MSQTMKAFARNIKSPSFVVDKPSFQQFLDDFEEWIAKITETKRAKYNKSKIREYLGIVIESIRRCKEDITNLGSLLFRLLVSIFPIAPDHELRLSIWECAVRSIAYYLPYGESPEAYGFFEISFAVQTLPVVSPQTLIVKQCEVLIQVIDSVQTRIEYLYWWRMISQHILHRIYETGISPEFQGARDILAFPFLKSLINAHSRFDRLTPSDFTKLPNAARYIIEIFRSIEETPYELGELHDEAQLLMLTFAKTWLSCDYKVNGISSTWEGIRDMIRHTDLPMSYWLTVVEATPSGSFQELIASLLKGSHEALAILMNLLNVCIRMVMILVVMVEHAEKNSPEYWNVMTDFATHSLRIRVMASEIARMTSEVRAINGLFSFLLLNQQREIFPFLCALAFTILIDRAQIQAVGAADVKSIAAAMGIILRKDDSPNKHVMEHILSNIGAQFAAYFAGVFLDLDLPEIQLNPVLYALMLRLESMKSESKWYFYFRWNISSYWNFDNAWEFMRHLIQFVDSRTGYVIFGTFATTLLRLSARYSSSKTFLFRYLGAELSRVLLLEDPPSTDGVFRAWHEIMVTLHKENMFTKNAACEWYKVLFHLIDKHKSIPVLVEVMKSQVEGMPSTIALIPVVVKNLTGKVISMRAEHDMIVLRYLTFVLSLCASRKMPESHSNIFPKIVDTITALAIHPDARHAEFEIMIIPILMASLFSLEDTDECVDGDLYNILEILIRSMTLDSVQFIAKLLVLPWYYDLVNAKCPELFDLILDSYSKLIENATGDVFVYMLIFITNLMAKVQKGPIAVKSMWIFMSLTERDSKFVNEAFEYLISHGVRPRYCYGDWDDQNGMVLMQKNPSPVAWQVKDGDGVLIHGVKTLRTSMFRVKGGDTNHRPFPWGEKLALLYDVMHSMNGDEITFYPGTESAPAVSSFVERSQSSERLVVKFIGPKNDPQCASFFQNLPKVRGFFTHVKYEWIDPGEKPTDHVCIRWTRGFERLKYGPTTFIVRFIANGLYTITQINNKENISGLGSFLLPKSMMPMVAGWSAMTEAISLRIHQPEPPLKLLPLPTCPKFTFDTFL